jgi:hypothetical protein
MVSTRVSVVLDNEADEFFGIVPTASTSAKEMPVQMIDDATGNLADFLCRAS